MEVDEEEGAVGKLILCRYPFAQVTFLKCRLLECDADQRAADRRRGGHRLERRRGDLLRGRAAPGGLPERGQPGGAGHLGTQYGGRGPRSFPGVRVVGWEKVGNYAIRFDFSDGHRTGLYTFDYLRKLASPPP